MMMMISEDNATYIQNQILFLQTLDSERHGQKQYKATKIQKHSQLQLSKHSSRNISAYNTKESSFNVLLRGFNVS